MEPDPGEKIPPSEEPQPPQTGQSVTASGGSSIRNVIQIAADGKFEGDVIFNYNRSDLEELDEYLKRAMASYEARLYEAVLASPPSGAPYKELQPFTIEEAQLFFGRQDEIDDLYDTVVNHRLMILHARSGAGKTSLLRAGLSPRLITEGRLPVYVEMRPYEENSVRFLKKEMAPSSLGPWPVLLDGLSLSDFLGLICNHRRGKIKELVIFFDQFDQFLTSLPDPKVRLPFIEAFGDCYDDPTLPVRFVISLRPENLADLDKFETRIPHILDNRYRLPAMTQEQVKKAISGPLEKLKTGVSFEPEFLETLLTDLGGTNLELTHLQIVCARLYASLPEGEKRISKAQYESLGKAERILTGYLEDSLSTLQGYEQEVARIILKELVSSEATNRILRLSDLMRAIPPNVSAVNQVLTYLVNKRLIRRGEVGEENEYELVHAYLAREIYHWIGEDDLRNRRAQELLQRQLANWRLYSIPPDPEEMNVFKGQVQYLSLDPEAREMILTGSLEQGQDVDFWIEQMEDRHEAASRAAAEMLANKSKREEIAACLKRGLAKELRADVLSVLWPIIEGPSSPRKREAAETLWLLKDWLTRQEQSRLRLLLFPVWTRRSLQHNARALIVFAIFFVPLFTWFFFIREKPVSGEWVLIPQGSFIMGMDHTEAEAIHEFCEDSPRNGNCASVDELVRWAIPRASVTLKGYDILDNEVTFAQYQQCVDEGKCQTPKLTPNAQRGMNLPVTNITWLQAQAYCGWLGGSLPTDPEWEKAARGPNGNYFPWGNMKPDQWDKTRANIERDQVDTVKSVLQFAKTDVSVYGVKNMAGNVQEWTATEISFVFKDLTLKQKLSTDPLSVEEAKKLIEEAKPRIDDALKEDASANPLDYYPVVSVRGGSWESARSLAFVSQNRPLSIGKQYTQIGFRCVCPVVGTCKKPWSWWWHWFKLN